MSDEGEDKESEKLPFRRFLIQEIRKALVPIVVAALSGAAAGGGVSAYQEETRLLEAKKAAEQEILRLEKVRDKLREEVDAYLRKSGSWEEVGAAVTADQDVIVGRVMQDMAEQRPLDRQWVQQALEGEIRHLTARGK